MKMPWTSRTAYDRAVLDAAAVREDATRRERDWGVRYEALLAQFTDLARKQVAEPAPRKPRERDDVIEAIMARAGSNGAIRSHLSSWAMAQRRAGTPDESIVAQVMVWASPDDATEGVP